MLRKERKEKEKRQRKERPAAPWVLSSSGTISDGTCLHGTSSPCWHCEKRNSEYVTKGYAYIKRQTLGGERDNGSTVLMCSALAH
jgi:hypothetical protein